MTPYATATITLPTATAGTFSMTPPVSSSSPGIASAGTVILVDMVRKRLRKTRLAPGMQRY